MFHLVSMVHVASSAASWYVVFVKSTGASELP